MARKIKVDGVSDIFISEIVVGPFVLWSSLGFFDGFTSGTAPLGVARSRLQGDQVVLSGTVIVPPGGTGANYHIVDLPAEQIPSSVRLLPTLWQAGLGSLKTATAISLTVDDQAGSVTGVPGAVFTSDAIATGSAIITLDGLSFVL